MTDKEQTLRDSDDALSQFTAQMADGRFIQIDARDIETARRLAREQGGNVGVLHIAEGAQTPDDADVADAAPATVPATGEPGQTTPSGPVTGEPGNQPASGPFAASGGNAGVGGGAIEDDGGLTGEALDKRAAELDIEGRSTMSADEKRAAVRKAERERNA